MTRNTKRASRRPEGPRLWLLGGGALILSAFVAVTLLPSSDDEPKEAAPTETAEVAAVAAEDGSPAPRKAPRAPRAPAVGSVGRTLGGLVFVLALLVGGAFASTKLLRRVRLQPGGEKILDLVDAVPLGPKRQVYVVSAYGRRLVIGAAGETLTLLSEFGEDEIGERPATPTGFPDALERKLDAPEPPVKTWEMQA